jgi:predicted kinase
VEGVLKMSLQMHVMIGNIGSGKSLIANKLSKLYDASIVNMDLITSMINGGEYNAYDSSKKEVYHSIEKTAIETSLKMGISVIIDRTNVDKERRKRFIEIGKKYGAKIIGYDFGPGNDDCLKRRIENPRGVPSEVWRDVFDYMKKSYVESTIDEGFSSIIKAPVRYKFYAFDFDGTIVKNDFPNIGDIMNGTVDYMNKLYQNLANINIVWTCRSGNYENKMRKFLVDNKIMFDFINNNPLFRVGSNKIYATKYYDDRNESIPVIEKS